MHLINGKRYHKAAREGNLKVLQEANRWETNAADENGLTPLLLAAHEGHTEAVRVLLKRKSKISKMDNFGNSALHLAAARGHLDCVKLFLSKNINPYGLDGGQRTACDLARIGEWDEVVELLEMRMKMLEDKRPKLVLKLKANANQQFLKIKDKSLRRVSNTALENNNTMEINDTVEAVQNDEDIFKSATNTPVDALTEEELYKQNFYILGLMQNKSDGLASSTSKSAARFHLVFSELVKEQSINQEIVKSLDTRPQRKPIKQFHPSPDDGDSEEDKSTEAPSENSLLSFLKIYDLQRFHQQLLDKGIDLDGLISMTEQEIKTLSLPLGPHRKLCVAVEEYRTARKWDQA